MKRHRVVCALVCSIFAVLGFFSGTATGEPRFATVTQFTVQPPSDTVREFSKDFSEVLEKLWGALELLEDKHPRRSWTVTITEEQPGKWRLIKVSVGETGRKESDATMALLVEREGFDVKLEKSIAAVRVLEQILTVINQGRYATK